MRYVKAVVSTLVTLAVTGSVLSAQGDDPPSRVARLSALVGPVSFQPSGATDWGEATLNYTVTSGDRLYTSPGSRAELEIGLMSVRLSENTDLTVSSLDDHFMQVALAQGTLRLTVYRSLNGDSVEVDTPNGTVVITDPGEYRFDVPANGDVSIISVDAGALEIMAPGIDQELRSGHAVQLVGTDVVRIGTVPRPGQTQFDIWSSERDHRVSVASCSRYMSRDIPGCEDLDDAGQWEMQPEFGPVWYPSHVAVDWVPYREGRWVWIAPWGWSWVEDEPWGYAPFHYGRWARVGPRWGWIPGPVEARPCYAPALVAFVGGSSFTVGVTVGAQAWFPLGPREAYFPSYHHDDVYLRRVNETNLRNVTNVTVILNAQNVTRVNYVNRPVGTTVVSREVFQSGRPVAHDVLRARPDELTRGTIISHPNAAPVERAILGPAVVHPPIAARPIMVTKPELRRGQPPGRGGAEPPRGRGGAEPPRGRGGAEPPRGRGGAEPPQRGGVQPPPPARGVQPPPQRSGVQPPPPARGGDGRRGDARGDGRGDMQRAETPPPAMTPVVPTPPVPPDRARGGRQIITRTPPPPANPPLRATLPAMQAHPGKPLEPDQVKNLRAGQPPGPAKDPEFPPHKVEPQPPAARGAPPPPARGASPPPARGAPPKEPPKGRGADSSGRGRGRGA